MNKQRSKKIPRLMKVYMTSSPKERPDALHRELNRIDRELGDSNVSTLPPFLRKLMIH
jgi:hypothetical protein